MSCVFCKIERQQAPARFVGSWADVFAIEPLGPVTPGHVLFIPRAHVTDFTDDPIVAAQVMAHAARYVAEEGISDANLITSKGEHATQTVFHLHLHVVPRTLDDGLTLPWTGQHG